MPIWICSHACIPWSMISRVVNGIFCYEQIDKPSMRVWNCTCTWHNRFYTWCSIQDSVTRSFPIVGWKRPTLHKGLVIGLNFVFESGSFEYLRIVSSSNSRSSCCGSSRRSSTTTAMTSASCVVIHMLFLGIIDAMRFNWIQFWFSFSSMLFTEIEYSIWNWLQYNRWLFNVLIDTWMDVVYCIDGSSFYFRPFLVAHPSSNRLIQSAFNQQRTSVSSIFTFIFASCTGTKRDQNHLYDVITIIR